MQIVDLVDEFWIYSTNVAEDYFKLTRIIIYTRLYLYNILWRYGMLTPTPTDAQSN